MSILTMVYDFIAETVLNIPAGHALETYGDTVTAMLMLFTFFVFGVMLGAIIKLVLFGFNIIASRFYL